MRHIFEEVTRKEERRGVSSSFSVWLFFSHGALFSYFHFHFFSFIILLL